MKKIVFVCHGNICRSPMAEYIMKDLVRKAGRDSEFRITSAAVTTEELGNDIYPPAKRKLTEHGVSFGIHSAHKITDSEASDNDLIIVMDTSNLRRIENILSPENYKKVHLMLEYSNRPGESVADPWYTGDFEITYKDLIESCTGLLGEME